MINTLSEVIRLDLIKENILSEIVCNYLILYIHIYIYIYIDIDIYTRT